MEFIRELPDGLDTMVVELEDIYDEFNYGIVRHCQPPRQEFDHYGPRITLCRVLSVRVTVYSPCFLWTISIQIGIYPC